MRSVKQDIVNSKSCLKCFEQIKADIQKAQLKAATAEIEESLAKTSRAK